jgi:hypothetical protein
MKVKIELEVDTNDNGDCQLIEELIEIANRLKESQECIDE